MADMSSNSSNLPVAEAQMPSLLDVALSGAIALAKDSKNYDQANVQFEALLTRANAS